MAGSRSRKIWIADGSVRVDRVDTLPWGGSDDWITWADTCDDWARANGRPAYELEAAMLRADVDGLLVFNLLTATSR